MAILSFLVKKGFEMYFIARIKNVEEAIVDDGNGNEKEIEELNNPDLIDVCG